MIDSNSGRLIQPSAIPSSNLPLQEEIEALRSVVSKRDHALLSLSRRMDQIIEEVRSERDRLDQAVKRERELSRFVGQVLGSIQDVLVVTDPDGTIVQVNAAAYRELGFNQDALLGIAVDSLLPAEVLAAHECDLPARRVTSASIWIETIARRGSYLEEQELLRQDGRIAGVFRVGAELLHNPQGKFAGVAITASNFTQRKEAERALAESEARLRSILDGSPIPLFVIDRNHRITHWNRACERMTGMSAAQMIGTKDHWRPFYDSPRPCLLDLVLDGADPGEIATHYGASIRSANPAEHIFEGEGYYPTVGKWLFFTAALIRDRQGHIVAAMESLQDITERKRSEEALRRSETRFRNLFEEVPSVAVQGYGPDGIVRYWNKASEHLYGYTADEAVGRSILDLLVPPPMREAVRNNMTRPRVGPAEELRLVRKDGSSVTVLSSYAAITTLDNDTEFYCLDVDLSELKRAQERLRLAATVFEHAHEGIMIADATGTIIEVNKAFVEITGYSRAEAVGRNPSFLKSGRHDAAFYAQMWQTLAERGYWHGEIWNQRKSGEIYPENVSISAVHDADGAITYYVGLFADITTLKENQQRLEQMAYYDSLTRLPNRALLADRLRYALAKAQREQRILAVCYLDLDGFKPVNDTWGHAAGDDLLIQVAQRLQNRVRADDTVARLGGDEFVVLLDDLQTIADGEQALQRILEALSAPFSIGAKIATASASIGVTFFPHDGADPDALIRHADQAMYLAKQEGRNRYHLFDPEYDRRAQTRRELLERAQKGLAAGEFCLYYQPKVDMRQGRVIGAEALLRWRHPEQGLLAPGAFIAMVENSDFAQTLGHWVLETALRQMTAWAAEGLALPVSVNLSARHLQQPNFVAQIESLLARYPGIPPERLELEIFETAALDGIKQVSRIIAACRQLGVRFAIDDFGTGYSSLTYLRHLPTQTLKIDQSFVRGMLADPGDLAIVRGVIGLAAAFKLEVIAEGVESVEHGIRLLQLGCHQAQGYGIARPMPAEAISGWTRQWRNPEAWNLSALMAGDTGG